MFASLADSLQPHAHERALSYDDESHDDHDNDVGIPSYDKDLAPPSRKIPYQIPFRVR